MTATDRDTTVAPVDVRAGDAAGHAADPLDAAPKDDEFQSLVARLGEAKAAYDLVVREVIVLEQPGDRFAIPHELLERWRDASDALRDADSELRTMLDRAAR